MLKKRGLGGVWNKQGSIVKKCITVVSVRRFCPLHS